MRYDLTRSPTADGTGARAFEGTAGSHRGVFIGDTSTVNRIRVGVLVLDCRQIGRASEYADALRRAWGPGFRWRI